MLLYDLFLHELVWNKEQVVLLIDGQESEMKRLEFHALDEKSKELVVTWIEPKYDVTSKMCYLLLTCELQ